MDYKEKLKHYSADLSDDMLADEAIASLEQYFGLMDEDELMHHNRIMAIAYLALINAKGG